MSDQYTKARFPWTTVAPAALSALDLGDVSSRDFRPTQWWGRPDEIFEQEIENDVAYLAFLDGYGAEQFSLDQPVVKYRVGRPADLYTTNDTAIATADIPAPGSAGYIDLADSLIVETGHVLQFNDYGVELRVLDVDDDNSEGWTNNAAAACNVKVERIGGPSVAIPAGTYCQLGGALMGELGTPSKGITTTPGDPAWNTMTMVGIYGSISKLQQESGMVGGWGTLEKIRSELFYQHRLAKQNALLFQQRYLGTDSQGAQGQFYRGQGIVPQIQTHIMEAGSLGINLVWPKLNDFLEGTFDSELSDASKTMFCGSKQFRDMLKTAREYNAELEMLGLQSGVQNPNSLGTNSFKVYLNSGKPVMVHELRKAFSAPNMADWGIVLDKKNLGYATFNGISEVWHEDIESNAQQITVKSDALVDTFMNLVKDESTMAVIRGGTSSLVSR